MDEVISVAGSGIFRFLLFYLLAVNVIAFFMYGIDKYKAIHHRWRIPEKVLILFAFLGGAIGALLGMLIWHHKTKKWKFRICVPLALVLWAAVLICLVYRG